MDAITKLDIDRVRGNERIASLDILRGVAILFILFMNIPGMGSFDILLRDGRYPTWTTADWWSTIVIGTALNGTQRGLLELLFGAGIMIMARRAMTADGPVEVADLHYRRNLLLIVLGAFNAFVLMWWGDILLTYGIAAVFLFPFRKWSPKAQLGLASLFFATMVWFSAIEYHQKVEDGAKFERLQASAAAHKTLSADDKKFVDDYKAKIARHRLLPGNNPAQKEKIDKGMKAHHSTFAAYWKAQFEGWQFLMGWFWIIEAEILGTMLIGMALYQLGIIQGRASKSTYLALLVGGYGLGLYPRATQWLAYVGPGMDPLWQEIVADLTRLAVTLGHLALIQLVLTSTFGRALLKPFIAAGRMPLTVYLGTSFLMMWVIFAPWGLGLWGKYGAADLALIAAVVIAAEVVAANVWLRYYECGPFEWVWKSLAYLRREPFRRPDSVSAPAMPTAVPAE